MLASTKRYLHWLFPFQDDSHLHTSFSSLKDSRAKLRNGMIESVARTRLIHNRAPMSYKQMKMDEALELELLHLHDANEIRQTRQMKAQLVVNLLSP